MTIVRTSQTHPLLIDCVDLSSYTYDYSGKIGMTFCPGKNHHSYFSDVIWDRDLGTDIKSIVTWGADVWLNLMEEQDLKSVNLDPQHFTDEIAASGLEYIHFPIVDGSIPDAESTCFWNNNLSHDLHNRLKNGQNLLIHCRGGLGRTGMIAARLLVEMGLEAQLAVKIVRTARSGAIENSDQERWCMNL